MENRETAKSHEAIPVQDADAPYAGSCGQTSFMTAHVQGPDGSLSSVSLCRAVNVQTHPELRQRALSGGLHRLDDGRQLALSFVYHDPQAGKFALVLPTVLAHTELAERSRLWRELAQDSGQPIPPYVKEFTVVVGEAGLAEYIAQAGAAPAPVADASLAGTLLPDDAAADRLESADADGVASQQLSAREHSLSERERALAEEQLALSRRAELLDARERELSRQREQVDSAQQALQLRERALSVRRSRAQAGGVNGPEAADSAGVAVAAGMHDGLGHARSHPPPLPLQRHRTGPPPLPLRSAHPPPSAAHARDPGARATALHVPPPLPHHAGPSPQPRAREPEVAPPSHFAALQLGQLAVRLVADELWLFAHVDESHIAGLRHGLELYLQYVEVGGYPVVLLSLAWACSADTKAHDAAPLRLALDGRSETDQRVLEHLSRSFRARVALYVRSRYAETLTVAALREGVAQAISDQIAELSARADSGAQHSTISAGDALLRVQREPPPLSNDDLPFGPARREASSTASVHASVAQLAAWLTPDKLREATLVYCTPRNVIDATLRRVLRAAVAFGIALPDELLERAVEQRVARDVPSLVRAQLQGFRQRVEQGVNDLGSVATRKNWERLFALAESHGVELDESLRGLCATQTQPGASGQTDAVAALPRAPAELSTAELLARLAHGLPPERLMAIEELCLRGQPDVVAPVFAALSKLERAQLPIAMAHLLLLGEAAADALIAALTAPDPGVRQLAALALGRLRIQRALLPLIELLEREQDALHAEVARALGDFGAAAARPLAEAALSSAQPERMMVALAHSANHGGAQALESLEDHAQPLIAQLARRAMASRSRLEWQDLAVRQQRTLEEADATTLLSQAFYAAVPKVAI